jgi:F0F1-type ATP synthase assembly protein I
MSSKLPDRRELGLYASLSQVGLEMVVPVVVGLGLDSWLGWQPWGVVSGAVLGLITGVTHLVILSNRGQQGGPPGPERSEP